MSDNLQKLIGVAAMAVLVVVGVVVSSGDDTDFTRNRSFSSATAMSSGTAKADCCDETLALLGSIQDELADNSSQLADNSSQLAEISSQLAENSSKLQSLLDGELEASTSGTSPDVQQIADQMDEACPGLDPVTWTTVYQGHAKAKCMRDYLDGFPLELARQVVLTHGKYGFFHRLNFDLRDGSFPIYGDSQYEPLVVDEACEPIFYGYNPPPRFAIAVDTKDGLLIPYDHAYSTWHGSLYIQHLDQWDLIPGTWNLDHQKNATYWPLRIEDKGFCE